MSTGSDAIPLLKAAPEADQIDDRLAGGPWRGLELCLAGAHVSDDEAVESAAATVLERLRERDLAVTAEAPVSWPSGAFVSVDTLDGEARHGIERSAAFAAAIGSPVLTIHLFTPLDAAEYRRGTPVDDAKIERFLRFYAEACRERGVKPLIENVPPVLRMRTGGIYLSPIGGHWRDLLRWSERVPGLGFTIDVSHAALFHAFAGAYPALLGLASDEDLEIERYVEELRPLAEVAHVSNASGVLGEGLPYDRGELGLDPVVRALADGVRFLVAEVNEPDPTRSASMKAAYRAIERSLSGPATPPTRRRARLPADGFDWQAVLGRRDPVPALVGLEDRFGGRRVLVTGGGGSIGRALASLLLGFRPERVTLLDGHEAALADDRRSRDPSYLERLGHVLCDIRERAPLAKAIEQARPDVVFHLAAYKHVDWAERFPEEFVDNNLHGSWNVLACAETAGVETVVVASTDKAALAASFYGRTKRAMEELTALAARRAHAERIAVRLVNVLGSRGSASELFLRQSRAGIPLTVTDTDMVRYWITMGHAATLAAHAGLLAGNGAVLAAPAEPATLTVGQLAERIWHEAGGAGMPSLNLVGMRPGETPREVLLGPGEELVEESLPGICVVDRGAATTDWPLPDEWLLERAGRDQARAAWLAAIDSHDLTSAASVRRRIATSPDRPVTSGRAAQRSPSRRRGGHARS